MIKLCSCLTAGTDIPARQTIASRMQTRQIFSQLALSSSGIATDEGLTGVEADEHITSAFEIATYLRKNVVQGIKNEQGAYSGLQFPFSLHTSTIMYLVEADLGATIPKQSRSSLYRRDRAR